MKQILCYVVLLFLLAFGCSTESTGPDLGIDFSWPNGMKSCFDTKSPEIRVNKVPENTRFLSVAVYDTEYGVTHGGGKVQYDGTGTIAEGALTEYKGPCSDLALSGPGKYEFTIKALDENNNVLATGRKTRAYPE